MEIEDVLESLKAMIGTEFDGNEVVEAFGDFEENGETEVIAKESENAGYSKIAYINSENSTQFLFLEDAAGMIADVMVA